MQHSPQEVKTRLDKAVDTEGNVCSFLIFARLVIILEIVKFSLLRYQSEICFLWISGLGHGGSFGVNINTRAFATHKGSSRGLFKYV